MAAKMPYFVTVAVSRKIVDLVVVKAYTTALHNSSSIGTSNSEDTAASARKFGKRQLVKEINVVP